MWVLAPAIADGQLSAALWMGLSRPRPTPSAPTRSPAHPQLLRDLCSVGNSRLGYKSKAFSTLNNSTTTYTGKRVTASSRGSFCVTSRSNLAAALGLLSRWRLSKRRWRAAVGTYVALYQQGFHVNAVYQRGTPLLCTQVYSIATLL
jgi:hypothetical protein